MLEDARRILSVKLTYQRRAQRTLLRPRITSAAFGYLFNYGLSSTPAIVSVLLLWLVGGIGAAYANDRGLLVVDFTPAATVVVRSPGGVGQPGMVAAAIEEREPPPPPEMPPTANALGAPSQASGYNGASELDATYIRCGNSVFVPVLALDLLIPILDLQQERKCEIVAYHPDLPFAASEIRLWKLAKTIYTLAGAAAVSLALLTVSGFLRKRAES
jgi:hypothetical protein